MLGEEHSCNNTHCRYSTRDAVRRAPDHGMRPALQGSQISANFRRHVACDQFDQDRTDENVRRILENRSDTHDFKASLGLPALSLCQRMDLDHVGTLGGTPRRNTAFIGGKAGIAQVEIVFKMLMSADEQEQITPGGQMIEHE
jgi:hypothetical protein